MVNEMTEEEGRWHQDRLNRFEKELESKRIRFSRTEKQLAEIEANFLVLFKMLYKTSKRFKNAIDHLPPATHPFDPVLVEDFQSDGISMNNLHNILIEWNRHKSFQKTGSRSFLKTFALLVGLSKKLNSEYETDITIINWGSDTDPERLPIYFTQTRSDPIDSSYRVKGKTIEQIEQPIKKKPAKAVKQFNHVPDRILIDDSNSSLAKSKNVLMDMFSRMSRYTPTFVGYRNRDGDKKLFVSLPEYLDISTLIKSYGRQLARIHHDFYQHTYKGRPKGMSDQLALLESIWIDKCRDKGKLSANQQAKILSEELMKRHNINLEPITIIRWYLPRLRKKNDKK
jgi:hypothetical protein